MIRLLLVDDEPVFLTITKKFLEKYHSDIECDTCNSAMEALKNLARSSYDAIVADYEMPKMNGIELLKEVRERFGNIPFILFTGKGREEVVIEAIDNGVDFYVQKYADPSSQFAELAHKIRHAVKRRRAEQTVHFLSQFPLQNPNPIMRAGRNGTLTFVNPASAPVLETWGVEEGGLLPQSVISILEHVLDEDEIAEIEIRCKELTYSLTFSPLRAENCVNIYGNDITVRKEAEDALKKSTSLLSTSQEIAHIGGWEYDPRSGSASWTDEMYRIHEISSLDELTIEDCIDFYAPEARSVIRRAFETLLKDGIPYSLELPFVTRTGKRLWVHTIGKADFQDGKLERVYGTLHDITVQKEILESLRESEERLQVALEGAGICVWEKNLGTGEVIYTENIAGVLGYTPEELEASGKKPQAWVHPEDLPYVGAALTGNLTGTAEFADATFRLKCRDGTWKWFTSRGRTVEWDEQGIPCRRLGVLYPIDHIVEAEERLRESELKMRTLLDAMVEPVVLLDKDGIIHAANSATHERIEVGSEDASLLCVWDFLPPENVRIRRAHIDEVIRTGVAAHFEDERAGRFLQHHIYPVVGDDGHIELVAAIAYDMTEIREQARCLKESQERLALALEVAEEGFAEWCIPTDEAYWSPHILPLLGYKPGEISPLPEAWLSLIHPEDRKEIEDLFHSLLAGPGDSSQGEYRMRTKSGEWMWILSKVRMIERDADGTPLRVVGTYKDITTRKLLEAQVMAGRDLAFGLAGVSTLEEAFSLSISYAMDVSGMDCGGLYLYDERSGKVNLFSTVGLHDRFVQKEMEKKCDPGRVQQVLWGGPQYPARSDLDDYHRDLIDEEGIRAIAILPILFAGKPIGCLNIASHTRTEIPQECREALETMTAEIGSAIARLQAQEVLKESNEALKSANHALNLLSSVTRHDILNQVSAMQAYLTLFEEEAPESPHARELCEKMTAITDTLRRQITFTGDYQNLGERDPEWQCVDWLVNRAAESVRMNGIQVRVPGTPLEIFADPMLEKAFFNLLDNAVTHGQHATVVDVSFHEEDGRGTVVVEDDGVGVPASLKAEIFEKGVGSGTGYGLFLVKEILDITDMTIRESGEEGKGARFEITIPRRYFRIAPAGTYE